MLTLILAILAGAAFVWAKVAESRGRSADEKMGAIPIYALSALLGGAAFASLAF